MLKLIIEYLNLKLSLTDYFQKNYCLTTLVETDSGEVYPAAYLSKGNFEKVNIDAFDGASYIRLREQPTTARNGERYTPKPRVDVTIPLRLVYSVRKSKLTVDDAYAEDRIALSLTKQLESDPLDLCTSLGADNVRINISSSILGKELWDDETANTGKYQPKYDVVYAAIDFDVVATFKQGCIPSECDFDTDILHSFDFCEQAVQARLTAAQIACLEAWLCTCADATVQLNGVTVGTIASGGTQSFTVNLDGVPSGTWDGDSWEVTSAPCADATVQLNGVDMADIPSGDTENILVLQSNDMTQVGSKQGTHWRIDDSEISINGSSVASVKAEDPLDIDVTQNGSPVGSWNGSAWIIPPCSSASLAITFYSDAGLTTPITTANYGQTVYINAVATGITPTSYSFVLTNGTKSRSFIQAGATLTWTVDIYGSVSVRASATDGSVGTSVTASSTLTVSVVKNALALDGVNDRSVGISLVDARSQSFSVSLWVKLNNSTSPQAILSFEEPWNTNTSFYVFYGQAGGIGVGTDSIRMGSYTLETALSNYGNITPDSDYHLLVTSYNYATKDMNLYWDNALIKTVSGWDFNQPSLLMYLGYLRNAAFLGIDYGTINVKDFRVHSDALSLATVQAMYADDTVMSGDELQWFAMYEPIGTTEGQITDILLGQKMNLNGITSPYGIVAG